MRRRERPHSHTAASTQDAPSSASAPPPASQEVSGELGLDVGRSRPRNAGRVGSGQTLLMRVVGDDDCRGH
jgi:hypothetical protein